MATKTGKANGAKKTASKKAKKTEEQQLRSYEMVVIINPELDEAKFNSTLDVISKMIAGMGGVVAEIKQWGKRKLAYPINNYSEGNYILTRFQLQPALSKEVEAKLQISEDVLRHLVVRLVN